MPPVIDPVKPVQVIDLQTRVPEMVTAPPPELPLKKTSSLDPGTLAPDAPPDESDQCVVDDPSHVPAPPTQKRDAIFSAPYLG